MAYSATMWSEEARLLTKHGFDDSLNHMLIGSLQEILFATFPINMGVGLCSQTSQADGCILAQAVQETSSQDACMADSKAHPPPCLSYAGCQFVRRARTGTPRNNETPAMTHLAHSKKSILAMPYSEGFSKNSPPGFSKGSTAARPSS